MRALVLGGSTFVGRRLVHQLIEQGQDVTVLNRGRTAADLPAAVTRIVADRNDSASMRAALGGTRWDVVHDVSGFVMAAGGSQFEELLELLDGRVGAFVFVSSIMAYAPSPLMPWTEDLAVRDEDRTTYGGFKAYAESRILQRHARSGCAGAGRSWCRTRAWSPPRTATSTTSARCSRRWPRRRRRPGRWSTRPGMR
jgi:nucleoside-diphosphate-sugar epimerase